MLKFFSLTPVRRRAVHALRRMYTRISINPKEMEAAIATSPGLFKKVIRNGSSTIYSLNHVDVELITGNCEELKKRLNFLFLELCALETQGKSIPEFTSLFVLQKAIKDNEELTRLGSMRYFFELCEAANVAIMRDGFRLIPEEDPTVPSFLIRTNVDLIGWINKPNRYYRYNGYQGMQFGQNLLLDFSFIKCKSHAHKVNLSNRLSKTIVLNGLNRRPFHLYFSNFLKNFEVFKIESFMRKTLEQSAVTVTGDCYSDLFSREKIVYFSPHASDEVEYDPESVYVLSPENDPSCHEQLASIANLKISTLPFGFKWKQGDKWRSVDEIYRLLAAWKNLNGQRKQTLKDPQEVEKLLLSLSCAN